MDLLLSEMGRYLRGVDLGIKRLVLDMLNWDNYLIFICRWIVASYIFKFENMIKYWDGNIVGSYFYMICF